MRWLLGALVATCWLVACGGAPTPTATPTPTPTPRPTIPPFPTATPTTVAAAFKRYTPDQVIAALMPLGITDVKTGARSPQDQSPNTATARREFAIPSIAPKGGQVLLFDTALDVLGMQSYFARFPDLAPYVYVKGNALLQLDSGLPKAEAEKYRAALESLP
jgi:hypothetical protein